jgi:hypothetical protein
MLPVRYEILMTKTTNYLPECDVVQSQMYLPVICKKQLHPSFGYITEATYSSKTLVIFTRVHGITSQRAVTSDILLTDSNSVIWILCDQEMLTWGDTYISN